MDIKTLLNNLHEEVSCSVCMDTFTDPKTLPCLHSFCLHCLRGIQRTSGRHDMITCPECRRETRISSGNLDALPTNFRINSLLDVLAIKHCDTTEAKCGNCDKKSSHSFYCFQCCVFWCEGCILHHNGLQANKKHRVLALKDFREEDFAEILKRPVFCQKQGHEKKELEFFCKRCEVAICSFCAATTHEGHAKMLLEEASEECKLEIKCHVESQKQAIQQKKNDIAKLDEKCHKIQLQVADVKRKVQAFSDNIIAAVVAKKEEIFNEVENQGKKALQRLGIGKSENEQQLKAMNASVARTETVLKRNSSVELIQFNKSVHTFPPEELSDRRYVVDRESESLHEFVYAENEKLLNDILNEGIGCVQQRLPYKTVPSKSSAEGDGIANAIVGQKAQFVLTTRNTDGRQCYSERDEVTLEISNQQRQNCMAEVQIEDRKDGTYNISYFVIESGKLDVSVNVNGNHVRGSPFGVQVKDRKYKPVFSFGQHGSSAGTLGSPWGVAVNKRDEIAVSEDENDRVQVFRSDGTFLRFFGGFGHEKGKFHYPRGIAFDQNGHILVSDSGNNRVQMFDEHGNYLDAFGEKGSLDSQLKDPSDLGIDSDGNIIIADSDNSVVKIFSTTKQILQKIGENVFKYPYSCVEYRQYLIVSDYHEDCVKVFDREQGTFLYKFGSVGNGDGQFKHPSCVAVDKAGHLMVCDENNHRIQVFKLSGEFVAKFGSQGSELGEFNLPCSIAVLSDGRIVVSDYANHRIQIFE